MSVLVRLKDDNTLEYPPTKINKDGKIIFFPGEELLREEEHFKDLVPGQPLPEREGYRQVKKYTEDETHVYERYIYEKIIDPTIGHRKISKGFLRIALTKLGYIDQFESMLKTMEIPLGDGKTLNGYVAWNDFLTIDEDSQMFSPVISQVKKAFNLTDEQYESIIKDCISKV